MLCSRPTGAYRVKASDLQLPCSRCQNSKSTALGVVSELRKEKGSVILLTHDFLAMTVNYVCLDVRNTRFRWMGPSGGAGGRAGVPPERASRTGFITSCFLGQELRGEGGGGSAAASCYFYSCLPAYLKASPPVKRREGTFAEGQLSFLRTGPPPAIESGKQGLPLSACAAGPGCIPGPDRNPARMPAFTITAGPGAGNRRQCERDEKRKSDE